MVRSPGVINGPGEPEGVSPQTFPVHRCPGADPTRLAKKAHTNRRLVGVRLNDLSRSRVGLRSGTGSTILL